MFGQLGDCAFVPDIRNPGKSHPRTAQHAIREGKIVAQNIAAVLLRRPLKSFSFKTIGLLASIGRRHRSGTDFWFQFLGLLRLVAVADSLPQQVARLGQKDSCGI